MASTISVQPMLTTTGFGSNFYVQSDGLMQGAAYDDPATRFYLANGVLASTETLPMWGGIAITESIPTSTPSAGGFITRATTVANITGFSTYNQASAFIVAPGSNAPSAGVGMTIPFFRLGSGQRLAVAIDPELVSLQAGAINQQVSWDFNNQRLMPYNAATATVNVTSLTASYSATTGLWTFAVVAAAPALVGAVGDAINLSGVTGTGASLINGNQILTSFTSTTSFSFQIAGGAAAFTAGAQTGTIVLNQSVGQLSVKILETNIGNSKIVQYNAATGAVTWVNTGSAAIILL